MTIKQISVFIENRQGRLSQFASLLDENNINLIALSIADTTDFGILRLIVDDTNRAVEIIKNAGYTANQTDVLALAVPDKPGGLARVLNVLEESSISIEYVYSSVRNSEKNAVIIFRVEETERAVTLLLEAGEKLLTSAQVRAL